MKRKIEVILMAMGGAGFIAALMLTFALIGQGTQNRRILNKLDQISSETDAKFEEIKDEVRVVNVDLTLFKKEQTKDSEELKDRFDTYKKLIDKELKRMDEELDALEIAKAEKQAAETAEERNNHPVEGIAVIETTYAAPTNDTGGLTPTGGIYWNGDQLETYYNLDMSVVVDVAHQNGIYGDYWIRGDGCKMLGDYIMVAANYSVHPYGSTVSTSLGTGIVVDTGGFAEGNPGQIDIAVNW